MVKNSRKRHSSRKHRGGYSSGTTFMQELVGTEQQQFVRVFNPNIGNDMTRHSNYINTISNPDIGNNWKGGRRRRIKRGGNIGAVLYQAIPSAVLLGAQNTYGKRKSSKLYKKNRSFKRSNKTRRNKRY